MSHVETCPNCGTSVHFRARTTKERSRASKDRLYSRRVLIDGRWVYPAPPEQHGSVSMYTNRGCRCVRCTAAKREWNRQYKAGQREAS